MSRSVFDFEAIDVDGCQIHLSRYCGRVLLIVNVASKCGFTAQYAGLESLYRKYRERGFEVLAFPCNQFLWQEPGNNSTIKDFCKTRYDVTFPVFAKVKVNRTWGDAHPLFKYLKNHRRGVLWTTAIKWNFTKFLVDRHGLPVQRFSPFTPLQAIEPTLQKLLEEPWPN